MAQESQDKRDLKVTAGELPHEITLDLLRGEDEVEEPSTLKQRGE